MASKRFLKPSVTIAVAHNIAYIITHILFHIRIICMNKHFHLISFPFFFCTTFLPAAIPTSISTHIILF